MGVKSLWSLLTPVGRPVMLETVEGKVMAIDSSIWIYQFQATMRDKEGRGLVNAHVLGFLRRITKLLFYGIKPVFVFDGGAPVLKKQTLNERKKKKRGAAESHVRLAERLLAAQMRKEAVSLKQRRKGKEKATVDNESDEFAIYLEDIDPRAPKAPAPQAKPQESVSSKKKTQWQDHDPYRLPDFDLDRKISEAMKKAAPDPRLATEEELRSFIEDMRPEDFDVTSPEFRELPTEVQYEIIGDLRLKSRQTSYARLQNMLKKSKTPLDFSKQQILNLKQRNTLTQQLLTTTDSIGRTNNTTPVRIASERNKQYMLVKNESDAGGWILAIRNQGTKDKPIVVEEQDVDNAKSDVDKCMGAVDIPNAEEETSPEILEYRRRVTLNAIAERLSPHKLQSSIPKPAASMKLSDPTPLFDPLDDEEDNALPYIFQVGAGEQEDLAVAIQLSMESQQARNAQFSTPSTGSSRSHRTPHSPTSSRNLTSGIPRPKGISILEDRADSFDPSTRLETALALANVHSSRSPTSTIPNTQPSLFGAPLLLNPVSKKTNFIKFDRCEDEVVELIPTFSVSWANTTNQDTPQIAVDIEPDEGSDSEDNDMEEIIVSFPPDKVANDLCVSPQTPTNAPDSDDKDMEEVPIGLTLVNQPTSELVEVLALTETAPLLVEFPDAKAENMVKRPRKFTSDSPTMEPTHSAAPRAKISARPILLKTPPTAPSIPMFTDFQKDEALLQVDPIRFSKIIQPISKPPVEESKERNYDTTQDTKADIAIDDEVIIPWTRSPSPSSGFDNIPTYPSGFELHTDFYDDAIGANNPMRMQNWDAVQEMDANAEEGEFARFLSQIKGKDLDDVRREIDDEINYLNEKRKAAMRDAEDVNQQMINQIMVMLRLFGIPYITAPMEAEAQCAELVTLGLVDGVITDDSDVFLFGAERVYKNMFNQSKTVECFLLSDLSRELGLERDVLIRLAYLLGSDYVNGLPGVGPVVAMELLKEFPGKDGLHRFKDWWTKVQMGKDDEKETDTKFKKRFKKLFKQLYLPPEWPNSAVRDAYYHPAVDSSNEPFKWAPPDLEALRQYLRQEIGWGNEKVDELLLPIIQKMAKRSQDRAINQQNNITAFFNTPRGSGTLAPRKRQAYSSKRLQEVVTAFRKSKGGNSATLPLHLIDEEDRNNGEEAERSDSGEETGEGEPPRKKSRTKSGDLSTKKHEGSTAQGGGAKLAARNPTKSKGGLGSSMIITHRRVKTTRATGQRGKIRGGERKVKEDSDEEGSVNGWDDEDGILSDEQSL